MKIKVLQTLIENDLEFGETVATFARYRSKRELAYVTAAQDLYVVDDGELEIDATAAVSLQEEPGEEDGAYVMAWVWVPKEEINEDAEKEEE